MYALTQSLVSALMERLNLIFFVFLQVYIYEFSNFVADVGGLLGLLLGASCLTIYDALMTMWNALKK